MSERDALIALNLLPLSPAQLRRLLDLCADAAGALDAIGTGTIRTEDLWVRPSETTEEDGEAAEVLPSDADRPSPADRGADAAVGLSRARDERGAPGGPGATGLAADSPGGPPGCPGEGGAERDDDARNGAPRRAPRRSRLRLRPGRTDGPPRNEVPLDGGAARRLGVAGLVRLARLEVERARAEGIRIETLADRTYPALLREIPDPPPVLYICGTMEPDDEVRVGIVGSRRATSYGLDAAGLLARDLVRRGVCVVSGLARGIDGRAHKGALGAGGRTVAVLGSGLGRMYPREHAELARTIARSRGAVISEYPFAMPPLSSCFPRRNRVIAGLSAGLVVVEAARASGALGTARLALDQGREVFAVPGPVTHETSIGTNGLLRAGAAHLACVAVDVLDELPAVFRVRLGLPVDVSDEPAEPRRAAFAYPLGAPEHDIGWQAAGSTGAESALDPETAAVLRHLSHGDPLPIDEVLARSGLPVPRALAALSMLEMRGLAEMLPGDRVVKVKCRLV